MSNVDKFDYVFSNPPYQKLISGVTLLNIYPAFVKVGSLLAKSSIMIHPARAFKGAGRVIKEDVEEIMSNHSFTVTNVFDKGSTVFPNTDIKGGVIITKYVNGEIFENGLDNFISPELKTILNKVKNKEIQHSKDNDVNVFIPITEIMHSFIDNKISEKFHEEHGHEVISVNKKNFKTNIFSTMPSLFKNVEDKNTGIEHNVKCNERIFVFGFENGKRTVKEIVDKDYVVIGENWLGKWKLFQPSANGSGIMGEKLAPSTIGDPKTIATQTYLTFGMFDKEYEAENCALYLHTKFARALLYTLKVTQQNSTKTWVNVPLVNFTNKSIIDWSLKSIHEIDQQLFELYELDEGEITWLNNNIS